MPIEECRPNIVKEQNASGASVNRKDLDKASSINLCTKIPPKPKSQIKNSSIPLTIYHQNIRGLRGKPNELRSQHYPTFPHELCISNTICTT